MTANICLRSICRCVLVAGATVFVVGCAEKQPDLTALQPIVDLIGEVQVATDAQAAGLAADLFPELTGIEVRDDALVISAGHTATFDLRLPDYAVFVFEGLEFDGADDIRLVIRSRRSGDAGVSEILRRDKPGTQYAVEVPSGDSEFTRVTLTAEGSSPQGSVVVIRPAVWARGGLDESPIDSQSHAPLEDETPNEASNEPPDEAPGEKTAGTPMARPNVVLYLIDTLRKDRLGVYGYDRAVSPNIDRFAAESFVFDDVVAQSPWTKPSVASIFTGLGPMFHKAKDYETHLSDSSTTMAEYLERAGYACDGFIENPTVREQFGFAQGFRVYSYGKEKHHDSASLMERVFQYLNSKRIRRPFFLFVHVMDPHAPYSAPPEVRRRFAGDVEDDQLGQIETLKSITKEGCDPNSETARQVGELYDAEVAFSDDYFGKFVEELKRLELYENTLLVLAVDHGEEFWERGRWGHSHGFHVEQLHVPLIIKTPGVQGGARVPDLAQHLDILPTVLDYAGVRPLPQLPGMSLRRFIENEEPEAIDAPVPDGTVVHSALDFQDKSGVSATVDDWKLIIPRTDNVDGGQPVLIHRVSDPGERENLYDQRPIEAGFLLSLIRRNVVLAAKKGVDYDQKVEEITEDQIEELRALGYVE